MGLGAFMRIVNASGGEITITVGDMNCMYDDGSQGSNLQVFNGVTVEPFSQVPAGGKQYIETVGSGSCAFEDSYFYLNFSDPPGGYVKIIEEGGVYSGRADPPQSFALTITPPSSEGEQANITIVMLGSSS